MRAGETSNKGEKCEFEKSVDCRINDWNENEGLYSYMRAF